MSWWRSLMGIPVPYDGTCYECGDDATSLFNAGNRDGAHLCFACHKRRRGVVRTYIKETQTYEWRLFPKLIRHDLIDDEGMPPDPVPNYFERAR